eukprot:4016563-Heterocapsa_arctica.AAC.1
MQCIALRCIALRCNAMRCDAMRCDAMRRNATMCFVLSVYAILVILIRWTVVAQHCVAHLM